MRGALKPTGDVRFLSQHSWEQPLARQSNGSLQLRDDDFGMGFTATLPDTTLGRDVAENLRSGLIDQMSFGFTVDDDGDEWSNDDTGVTRTIRSATVSEISAVTTAAYPQTSVSLRSAPGAIRALLSGDIEQEDFRRYTALQLAVRRAL
jgi:hypothetical protein